MVKVKRIFLVATICMCIIGGVSLSTVKCDAGNVEYFSETRMTYISTYSVDITISESGQANISGEVSGKPGVTCAYVKVTLQEYVSGNWVDVESWERLVNERDAAVSETYPVARGTYRVYMTCSADTETKVAISEEKTY